MELLFLLQFETFPVEEKAICGVTSGQRCTRVVCLSMILLEGGETVSNNFTKRRQNGLKTAQETSPRHIWGWKTSFQMR